MYVKPTLLISAIILGGCAAPMPTPPSASDRPVYAGFDTWRYPGDAVMLEWRQHSPYRWVGYYLPAPCHRATSYAGKRSFLTQAGWGIAVIYVGQQLFEGQTPAEITETTLCSSRLLTAERGAIDGRDAVARTRQEGFPPGSVIFLDIERVSRVTPELAQYYEAWLRTVLADGTYRPGTYAHIANAQALFNIAQSILVSTGTAEAVPFWIAGGSGFTLQSPPDAVGFRFARIWQGVLDTRRTWGAHTLVIDENVSRAESPSAPESLTRR